MALVLSRRKGQQVRIGDDIWITVTELHRSSCKLAIEVPRGTVIYRAELDRPLPRLALEEDRSEAQLRADGDFVEGIPCGGGCGRRLPFVGWCRWCVERGRKP